MCAARLKFKLCVQGWPVKASKKNLPKFDGLLRGCLAEHPDALLRTSCHLDCILLSDHQRLAEICAKIAHHLMYAALALFARAFVVQPAQLLCWTACRNRSGGRSRCARHQFRARLERECQKRKKHLHPRQLRHGERSATVICEHDTVRARQFCLHIVFVVAPLGCMLCCAEHDALHAFAGLLVIPFLRHA